MASGVIAPALSFRHCGVITSSQGYVICERDYRNIAHKSRRHKQKTPPESEERKSGAASRTRTGDPSIFSALLYQLSYRGTLARMTGLEPATSGVTGRRSNQLSYTRVGMKD